jgi:hypothetical protein
MPKISVFFFISFSGTLAGAHNDSSCSSGPESPHIATENSDHPSGRAQYVSATCVVFTHYSGDVATVVDEHFTRALNFSEKNNSKGKTCDFFLIDILKFNDFFVVVVDV